MRLIPQGLRASRANRQLARSRRQKGPESSTSLVRGRLEVGEQEQGRARGRKGRRDAALSQIGDSDQTLVTAASSQPRPLSLSPKKKHIIAFSSPFHHQKTPPARKTWPTAAAPPNAPAAPTREVSFFGRRRRSCSFRGGARALSRGLWTHFFSLSPLLSLDLSLSPTKKKIIIIMIITADCKCCCSECGEKCACDKCACSKKDAVGGACCAGGEGCCAGECKCGTGCHCKETCAATS